MPKGRHVYEVIGTIRIIEDPNRIVKNRTRVRDSSPVGSGLVYRWQIAISQQIRNTFLA
jgi:hypothetical protein